MRRTATNDPDVVHDHQPVYELDTSPAMSLYTISDAERSSTESIHSPKPKPTTQTMSEPISPSIRLLFSSLTHKHYCLFLLPALVTSVIAGGIAPFMTYVIGQVFDAFSRFSLSTSQPADKDRLLHDVGIGSLQLVGLAVGSLALSSITSCLWIWVGERNVSAIRQRVYQSVTAKEMAWFDTKLGGEVSDESDPNQGPLGAGGLMTKFTRWVCTALTL